MAHARNILLVEDDRDLLPIMKRFLESEGYHVDGAASAEDAYDLLAHKAYSVVVLDINLPGDDGIQLCTHLRRAASTPVIFASARVEDDARAMALESGGDAFLSKPFSLRELRAQVRAVESRLCAERDISTSGSLTLDVDARQIFKSGEPVELSPKEFELAAALISNSGTALSKKQLMADVWGAFSDVQPQTLAVHMRWLREKLEDDPAHPVLFETVRGFGYRFSPAADTMPKEKDVER